MKNFKTLWKFNETQESMMKFETVDVQENLITNRSKSANIVTANFEEKTLRKNMKLEPLLHYIHSN